jgi:nitrite reductase/ring-hydroxylating ferredoxin subunit
MAIEYYSAGELDYFPEEKIRRVFRGDREIAIVRYKGEFYAFSSRCTHADFQLHFGFIEDGCLWCPIHYGQFNVTTGEAIGGPVTDLKTFPVRIEGDTVFIGVPHDEAVESTANEELNQ